MKHLRVPIGIVVIIAVIIGFAFIIGSSVGASNAELDACTEAGGILVRVYALDGDIHECIDAAVIKP